MKQQILNEQLLNHEFDYSQQQLASRYLAAKQLAAHYAQFENAVVVLSNMADNLSYICYGHLGSKLGIGEGCEEVDSIWEEKILDRIHPDDRVEKIAWELQFLSFMRLLPENSRTDYYLQHFLRMRNDSGDYVPLRHRIFYLDYDSAGNVWLVLCVYTAVSQFQGVAGVVCSLDDTMVDNSLVKMQGLLSVRECEVLKLISEGLSSKRVAELLSISANTVNNHRQNIIRKLQSRNITEAVIVARRLGLIKVV